MSEDTKNSIKRDRLTLNDEQLRLVNQAAELAAGMAHALGVAIGDEHDFLSLDIPGFTFRGPTEALVDDRGRGAIQRIESVHGLAFRPLLVLVLPSAMVAPAAWWNASVIELTREVER